MDVVVQSSWDGSAWWRTVFRAVLLVLLAAMVLMGATPARADLAGPDGGELFANHCAGCHVNGGNIIRRGKTLRLAALERNGIHDAQRIAAKLHQFLIGWHCRWLLSTHDLGVYLWRHPQQLRRHAPHRGSHTWSW
jgi:hypothetical protein